MTIEPQRYFLDQIVGDAFDVNTLVPVGTSPEAYEPAPSVMVNMGKSELYFMVGDLDSKMHGANDWPITIRD